MILTPCIPYYNSASYDGLYFEGEETGAQETLSLKAKISLSITGKAKLTPTLSHLEALYSVTSHASNTAAVHKPSLCLIIEHS